MAAPSASPRGRLRRQTSAEPGNAVAGPAATSMIWRECLALPERGWPPALAQAAHVSLFTIFYCGQQLYDGDGSRPAVVGEFARESLGIFLIFSTTLVTVAQPCANSGNVKGQQLNVPSYIENVFELLGHREAGHPGEFFVDAHAGYLYYVPHVGETRTTTVAHLPTVEHLIDGESVAELSFSGITFEHTTWMRPSTGDGFVEIQSGFCNICRSCSCGNAPCREANCSCTGRETPAAVRFSRARGVRFNDCRFQHIGSNGVSFRNGSVDNIVLNSRFEDISASAVAIGTRSNPDTLPVAQRDINNTVSDCTILRSAVEFRGHPGLLVGFSHGTLIQHNELAFLPYTAISLGWGWSAYPHTFDGGNRILSNNIHHHVRKLRLSFS